MSNIQDIVEQIALQVNEAGGKMFYIGGCVRDLYLGEKPSDIDVRVIGISKNVLSNILEKYGKIRWINARFDLVKIIGLDIDFSSPENKDGTIKTLEDLTDDIDFTMNSICVDVVTSEVIDPFNGIEDIKNRIIRIARIDDIQDELLAVRGCRFKSKLGLNFDKESEEKIKSFSFHNVNKQRIFAELRKVIADEKISHSKFYRSCLELNILEKLFAPLNGLNGLNVNCNGIDCDAFEHTMKMLDYFVQFREEITDFEEFYITCLTYHLKNIGTEEIFREFFDNILATNKMKKIVDFFQENENKLFSTYNNFQNMSDEKLAVIYIVYRQRLEYAGYLIESYNMGLIENPTPKQLQESKKRLENWRERIKNAREQNVKTIKKVKTPKREKFKKKTKRYTFGDIKDVTKDISPEQVKAHLNKTQKNIVSRRRKKGGRNR